MTSKYGYATTAAEIANNYNLAGKNVIVTGGYTGIGRETCKVLAARGAHVFVAGRDNAKAIKVAEELKKETNNDKVSPLEVDLSSFASVRKGADAFNKLNIPLHILILNAGVMACPFAKSVDGFESQFATNVLGHYLFTRLLVPRLIEGAPARVVSVSSSAHFFAPVNVEDINFEKRDYTPFAAYGQSKTGNILFAVEFNRRYKAQGVTASSLHPGSIKTELQRHITGPDGTIDLSQLQTVPGFAEAMKMRGQPGYKTVEQGASTSVFAALSEEAAEGGKFYNDNQEYTPAPYASDPEAAKKLWEAAEKWVGL